MQIRTKYCYTLLSILLLFSNTHLQAQPKFDFEQLKLKHKNAYAVYLNYSEHLNVEIVDGKIQLSTENKSELLFLDAQAKSLANKSVFYTETFGSIDGIEAATYVPDGKRLKKIEVREINDRKPVSNGVFYDDTKEKYFIFPGAQPGAVAMLNYTELMIEPRFAGSFYFSSYIPVEQATFSVTYPKEVKMKFKLFGDTAKIQFSQSVSKNKITSTWSATDIEEIDFEGDAPSLPYYATHIIPFIESYTVDGETHAVLKDVSELYKWYAKLVKNSGSDKNSELKVLADSLTKNLKTDAEKTKAVFYWVQDHIKYIAWEDGLGGFIPRKPELVYQRRYGDCKDMANLTTNLLKLAGIDAHLTWIGTRHIPYTYEAVPTPSVDNHMISAVKENGQWLFLDATGQFVKYGMPSTDIQSKEALIGIDETKFEVVKVPVVKAAENLISDSIFLSIENNAVKGRGHRTMTGLAKYNLVARWIGVTPAKRNESLAEFLEFGNNKCKTDSVSYTGYDNRDSSLDIDFSLSIGNYITSFDKTIYVNLNLDKKWQASLIDLPKRKLDMEADYKYMQQSVYVLQIPAGYSVSKLPDASQFNDAEFGFDISYKVEKDKIIFRKTIYSDFLILPKTKFEKWNEMINKLNMAYKKVVELQSK